MPKYIGDVITTTNYVVNADDIDQAKDFILDIADVDFTHVDTIVVKNIEEIA